jgi:hypothetical protein
MRRPMTELIDLFLKEMLKSIGFGRKRISWVLKLVRGGSITIRINDVNSPFFRLGKDLRQGDPLSPLFFNLVVNVFTKMLIKAANRSYITGLILYPEGVISLQYADNTLLLLEKDIHVACHLK